MRRLLLLAPFALLLAGCGAARTSDPALDNVAHEAAAAGSSRIAISFGEKASFFGEFDYERNIGVFAWGGEDEAGDWDQIITSEATYTRFRPEDLGGPSVGRRWIKSPTSREGDGLFGIFPSDPVRVLDALRAASDVKKIETGEERDVKVTRYEARLDVDRAVDAVGFRHGYAEKLGATIRQYWTDGAPKGIPLGLAVDAEGLLRRVDVVIPDGESLSLEFFDYGIVVAAKPPPADEVLSWQELIQLMQERCSAWLEGNGGEQPDASCAGVQHVFEDPTFGKEPND